MQHAIACWSTWRKLRGDGRKKIQNSMYLWRLLCRIARRCRHSRLTYQPQRVSELASEDSQHLEMLPVVVHTIVRGFLSWMNLFETVWKRWRLFRKVLNYDFCMWQFELVQLFVDRSLGLDPKFVGFSPKWCLKPSLDKKVRWDLCWELRWRLMGGKPTFKGVNDLSRWTN